MAREAKAKTIGAISIWMEYNYDPKCLVTGLGLSLKDLLFRAKRVDM